MNQADLLDVAPTARTTRPATRPAPTPGVPRTRRDGVADREFMTMSRVFGAHGGLLTADDLVRSMRTHVAQPLSIVARWITQRAAVHFTWQSHTWFPYFQFAHNPMSIRPVVSEIVSELRDAYDDWELALWFARRNEWLDHALPVEAIRRDAVAAVRAARADRFIAKG